MRNSRRGEVTEGSDWPRGELEIIGIQYYIPTNILYSSQFSPVCLPSQSTNKAFGFFRKLIFAPF